MANPEHLEILKQGVEVWNRWRERNPEVPPNLVEADLTRANFTEANLREAQLGGTILRGAILTRADLTRADLTRADLTRADLAEAYFVGADLTEAYFTGANLTGANLTRATLTEASFARADLTRATLTRADLTEASFIEATLIKASFTGAILTRADLRRADLTSVDLTEAILKEAYFVGADFNSVILYETALINADLTVARGLDSCIHHGPSAIDYRTLATFGKLPLAFLRGCGLPDALIDYLPSLLNDPIQLYSVFISYSHQDEAFAKRLYDTLQGKGVRCWYAPEDIRGGKKIYDQIDAAIRIYDKLLLVLSNHSMNSEWVKTEIANARRREVTQNKRMLFPIRLVDFGTIRDWTCFDTDTGKDSAREIREYFIPDFTNWKDHDSFEHAFTRLLRDLKADETPTST